MAALMREKINIKWDQYNYLLPIPTTVKKLIFRGYNQAALLSQCLGEQTRLTSCNILQKLDSSSQRNKTSTERRANLRNKFQYKYDILSKMGPNPMGIIVDDVVTSGATILSAYEVLKPHFKDLVAITFAASSSFFPNNNY